MLEIRPLALSLGEEEEEELERSKVVGRLCDCSQRLSSNINLTDTIPKVTLVIYRQLKLVQFRIIGHCN